MKYKTLDSFYSLPDLPKYPPGQKRQIKMRGQWVDFEMEGQTTRLITVHLISGNANDDAKSNQRRTELDYALKKAAENSSAIVTGDCNWFQKGRDQKNWKTCGGKYWGGTYQDITSRMTSLPKGTMVTKSKGYNAKSKTTPIDRTFYTKKTLVLDTAERVGTHEITKNSSADKRLNYPSDHVGTFMAFRLLATTHDDDKDSVVDDEEGVDDDVDYRGKDEPNMDNDDDDVPKEEENCKCCMM